MTHLAREELERWWNEGLSADRERIEGHLGECDVCGALYGEVIDNRPLSTSPAAQGDAEITARGHRVFGRGGPRRMPRPARLGLWAAAAAVALAALVPLLRAPAAEGPTGIRGTSLLPTSPLGEVEPPVRFRWESPVRAARYVVEVRDVEQRPLFSLASQGEEVALPSERLAGMTPGRTYWWSVVAHDVAGDEIMRGPARSFSLSSAAR
jgi:hypothetical protein